MLDFIKEKKDVWEKLLTARKPIILYGMGNGADKILDWCESNGVQVSGIFASDGFVRYQQFRGFTVCSYQDIIERFGENILIVLAFASELPEVLAKFRELAARHEVLAPHLPLFAEEDTVSWQWLVKYASQLQQVYDKLADEQSRKVFAAALNYKLSGDIKYLLECETERRADLTTLFTWTDDEVYLDLGAYNGDTVQEFLELTGGRYRKIIAVEPDRRNFKKLEKLHEKLRNNFVTYQKGIWSHSEEKGFSDSGGRQSTLMAEQKKIVSVDSIDNLCCNQIITYIKMDVEGVEKEALEGGRETISSCKPKIMAAAYHYDADIFRLPLLLWQLVPEYKIYLRKHPYIPAWELNFFAAIKRD